MKKFSIILLGAVLAGCAGPQGQLTSLAEERLSLAPDIAWYKHSRNVPVYDPARETAVLQTVMAAGQQQGLNPDTVRRFFANEMEASRRIQWAWIEAWRKNRAPAPTSPAQDLGAYIRPQIDDINQRQLRAMARGAQPLSIAQLSAIGARFLPKN
ncbi:MAG: gamma subclass chorismate mutase AroQ [Chthoniobacterales bacterium]|jgi:chorismate mutase